MRREQEDRSDHRAGEDESDEDGSDHPPTADPRGGPAQGSAVAPHLVLSPFATGEEISKTQAFVAAGNLGALPLFAEPGARQAVRFRARALAQIAERLLRVMDAVQKVAEDLQKTASR